MESREERVYNDGSSLPPETVSYTFPCISGQCFTHGVSLHRMANGRGSSSREARVQSALEIRDQTVNLTLIHRMGRKIFYLAAFPRRCSFRFEMLVSSEEEKFLFFSFLFFSFFCIDLIDLILGTSGSLIISDYGRKIFDFRFFIVKKVRSRRKSSSCEIKTSGLRIRGNIGRRMERREMEYHLLFAA